MNIKHQKYLIILFLLSINGLLSGTFIYFQDKWFIFIIFLALASGLNSINSLLLLGKKICNKTLPDITDPSSYIYVVPCYNESDDEISNTIDSIVNQRTIRNDKRILVVICDGKVKGIGNEESTDQILLNIFGRPTMTDEIKYLTRENKINSLQIYNGYYKDLPYILLIKEINAGKRDSIVLIRKACYCFNINFNNDELSLKLSPIFKTTFNYIDYIIGTDADTILDNNCSYELIKSIECNSSDESNDSIYGCVGYVDINNTNNLFSIYQYAEYMFSQCLKRQAQSILTNKVNCLSGCNQILKVSEETCGFDILQKFNYCPKEEDNIFTKIRSIASEDRNHVCLMLSEYPYVKTIQNLNAIAYTNVPTSIKVFLSQRRRWSLGANSNDMLLLYLPNINNYERLCAFVNILTYMLSPFIFIATVIFIKSIIINPTFLMLYLSTIMIIPFTYGLLIPIFIKPMVFKTAMFYYFSYLFYIIFGSFVNLTIYLYSIGTMDIIKWGKTRQIAINAIRETSRETDV
jgi:chitin synthase